MTRLSRSNNATHALMEDQDSDRARGTASHQPTYEEGDRHTSREPASHVSYRARRRAPPSIDRIEPVNSHTEFVMMSSSLKCTLGAQSFWLALAFCDHTPATQLACLTEGLRTVKGL
jgi:hypothetical protein